MILLLPIIIITIIIEYNPIIILESNRIAYELSCLFRKKKTPDIILLDLVSLPMISRKFYLNYFNKPHLGNILMERRRKW